MSNPTFRTPPFKIRTPPYYGQFSLSLPKAWPTFSLNSTTRLIRTPGNAGCQRKLFLLPKKQILEGKKVDLANVGTCTPSSPLRIVVA